MANTAIIISETELKQTLSEISRNIVSEMFAEIKRTHPPQREVMTVKQLAEYWQVTQQSLWNWIKRDENRLPVHYVGGDPRFHLSEVDLWSKEEANRKLNINPSQDSNREMTSDLIQ